MLLVVPGYAQRKQIGEARTILLRGKDFAKAEKMMTDLLKDSVHRIMNKLLKTIFIN